MIPAIKEHQYEWPDTPREEAWKEYERRKDILADSGLTDVEFAEQVVELAKELGI